jgi:hypothetical protein
LYRRPGIAGGNLAVFAGRRLFVLFVVFDARIIPGRSDANRAITGVIATEFVGHVIINRAGVGHLFGDTEFVQLVDDLARLYFQLPRQLLDSDLTHIQAIYLPCLPTRAGSTGTSHHYTALRHYYTRTPDFSTGVLLFSELWS